MVNSVVLYCPPLTTDEIVTLRGKPAVKMAGADEVLESANQEEWIYFNLEKREQEHYFFADGLLIGWCKRTRKPSQD